MEDWDKLILGDDRTLHLDSPFGNYIHRPHYLSINNNFERRDLKKEEEESKQREEETENLFEGFKLMNCKQMLLESKPILSTGCRYINEFLGGGIPTQKLVEIYGEGGTGKTQFAVQLLLNAILPVSEGGLGGKALYILTQKHLSEKRFTEIKENFLSANIGCITSEDVDKRIMMFEAFKLEEYNVIFNEIENRVKEEGIKCIIIDNISSVWDHFINIEMSGSTVDYLERASFLNKQASTLKSLAFRYDMVVITINNVVADMMIAGDDGDASRMYTEKFRGKSHASKPALGLIWSSHINDRICLKKTQHSSTNFTRKMLIDASSHWPHNEMEIEIKIGGVFAKS